MPEGQVLEFSRVTKRFGAITAVSDFTARVEPGLVTGFLGPNGAGKTTSLRVLLGLVRPTSGTATIGGVAYAKLPRPLQTVGAVLEASSFHPGRSAAAHLTVYAHAAGVPKARVDEVLALVGLTDAASRKVGGFSLGMRQRLGLAYALLGDPGVLVLDEPTNGLDPEGIKWIRGFLRQLAREGRTVLVSSHLLTEVQQTVDALLIISQGRLVFQGGLEELSDPTEQATVVDSGDRAALAQALTAAGIPFEVLRSGLTVRGIDTTSVGLAAAAAGVPLSSLHKRGPALEEVFLDLVNGTRVHASASGTSAADVIPALESGPIEVVEVAELAEVAELDGAVEVAEPEAEASAPEPEPEPEAPEPDDTPADADALPPEADADDLASVAAELQAESTASPAAAGAGSAAFAVASTGVIDIIPADVPEPEPEPELEPETDPEIEAELEPETDPEIELEAEADFEPESDPTSSDRPWEDYVKTDADLEADRFFGAFDPGPEGSAEPGPDPDPPADPEAPGAPEGDGDETPAHEASAHEIPADEAPADDEGGEQR